MADKIQLVEEFSKEIIEGWYRQARDVKWDGLMDFLSHLMNDYEHDYGTICHALSAGAVATAWAMNSHEQGGITGFQAGFVMWGFIQNWMSEHKGNPLRLVDYKNMLYPQYEDNFKPTISEYTANWLKEQAEKLLIENDKVAPRVREHWESIVAGHIPFNYTVEKKNG